MQKQLSAFMLKLGHQIHKKRMELNMTQAELAEKADISVTYISKIECGYKNVSAYVLAKIMNALNLEFLKSIGLAYVKNPLYEEVVSIIDEFPRKQTEEIIKILRNIRALISK